MSANTSQYIFDLLDADYDLSVLDYFATEKISYLSCVNLTLVSNDKDIIPSEKVIRQEALLTIINPYKNQILPETGEIPDRYFHGVIRKFSYVGMTGNFHIYEAQLVPSLWLLSLKTRCRIFQDMKLQDIVGKILQESGITSDLYEFRLQHDDIFNKFNMQYNETDLYFISRLLEKEGIFYFFEHYEDRHVLVFCDTDAFCREIKGNTSIQLNSGDGLVSTQESISSFDFSGRLRSGTYTHTNYNFKTPSIKLETVFEGKNNNPDEPFEVYTYPGSYGKPARGDRLAQIRLEAILALKEKGRGTSNCILLTPGATFYLTDHHDPKVNQEFLLIEVSHGGSQPGALKEQAPADSSPSYSNSFVVIPATVTYRPEQRHLKPMVPGLISAIVTGPKGEEIWPDEYGRVNVQFHFDREGNMDEKSSCWLRVIQFWNGPTWGSQFIPRVGDEVLVSFINGDMDYPVVVGSVVNAAKVPNYSLPANKTQSGIRTRSSPGGNPDNYNELRFEDKKGAEEIYLQGEKDWNILIKNDKGQYVGHDETLNVRNNRTKTVGVNQVLSVGSNDTETIGATKTETIGANKNETVAVNKMETIGAAKELSIGGLYQVTVGGIMNETVACAKTEEVGLAKAVFVGTTMTENVVGDRTTNIGASLSEYISEKYYSKANEYMIEAPKITLKAGSSTIVMDGSSITIKASKVFTN
jgi:type VI secretion system secreted protein VgrG